MLIKLAEKLEDGCNIPNRPLYQCKVMPLGLFRLKDKAIPYNLNELIFVYLGDLSFVSEDFASHITLLPDVAYHIRLFDNKHHKK